MFYAGICCLATLKTTYEDIDGEAFLELDDEELKALGQKIGVIKKLRRLKDSVSVFFLY